MSKELTIEVTYHELLKELKQHIRSAQAKAALSVNSSLIQLYWNMGKMIAGNQALFEGRNNYVEQLAKDLRDEFPDMKGFSRANLFFIRKFYQFYSGFNSVEQVVRLEEDTHNPGSVQQLVAMDIESSVQQPVSLNALLLSAPWGHPAKVVCH